MIKLLPLWILLTAGLSAFPAAAQDTELPASTQNRAGQSFAPLVEKLLPGVVNISTARNETSSGNNNKMNITSSNAYIRDYFLQDEGGKTSLGSGFLIDGQGYIVTNNHVIDGASEIIVTLSDNRQFPAAVIGADKMTDLALIKISVLETLPFVKLGDSDTLHVGDWILAIGNPFGLGGSVTAGIVSAKSRDIDAGSYDNFIQTDASINQGSSGGPMFDMKGEVVGINTAIFSSTGGSMGIGFATPVNLSKFVVEQLIAKGRVERGWLGLKVTSGNEEIVLSDSQTFTGGVVVNTVTPEGPAAAAGIEAGDIIMAFNGTDVKDAKGFSRRVAEMPARTQAILRIWRNHQPKDITVTIAQMQEENKNEKTAALPAIEEQPSGYIEDLGLVAEVKGDKVILSEVLADSDAAAKGLKSGDIIQKADGKDVSSLEDLRSYASYAKSAGGPPMELKIISDGQPQSVFLKVSGDD